MSLTSDHIENLKGAIDAAKFDGVDAVAVEIALLTELVEAAEAQLQSPSPSKSAH